MDAGGTCAAGVAGGIGCRGPDRIWPGRGAGTGRAGTGPVRKGGWIGDAPEESGGRNGAGRRSSSPADAEATGEASAVGEDSGSGVPVRTGSEAAIGADGS